MAARGDGICGTDLKLGDVIQLNSGGPHMTVIGNVDERELRCAYFDHDVESEPGVYNVILLPREAVRTVEFEGQ